MPLHENPIHTPVSPSTRRRSSLPSALCFLEDMAVLLFKAKNKPQGGLP